MPAGKRRFAALLNDKAAPAEHPWNKWSPAQQRVFNAVRSHHHEVAGIDEIAATANVSVAHTRRCLKALSTTGFVKLAEKQTSWGYDISVFRVWQLDFTEQTLAAMMAFPYEPLTPSDEPPTVVPPQFWSAFWSGSSADELRLPEDGVQIAESMLSSGSLDAYQWALQSVPVEALQEVRSMRGYTSGEVAIDIDRAIQQRNHA